MANATRSDGALPLDCTSEALFQQLRRGARDLELCLARRRNRDRASRLVTDLWAALQVLALRVGQADAFDQGPEPRPWDDDGAGLPVKRGREIWDALDGDPALAVGEDGEDDDEDAPMGLRDLMGSDVVEGAEVDVAEGAGYVTVEAFRQAHFRDFLRFLMSRCRDRSDIAAKVETLAVALQLEEARRYCGGKVTLAALSRKAKPGGEKRATTSARYKREVKETLRLAGALGINLGGVGNSESHAEACRAAQTGRSGADSNRRKGHKVRVGAALAR